MFLLTSSNFFCLVFQGNRSYVNITKTINLIKKDLTKKHLQEGITFEWQAFETMSKKGIKPL